MPLECFLLNITLRDLPGECEKKMRKMRKNADRIPPPPLPFARQRLLWCIRGSNSPWHEFVRRHGSCLLKKEAASNTCTVRNKQNLKHVVSTACRPRVFQIALFKGFPNIPQIPLPPEHSVGTNKATMAPTPENPESWYNRQRPREFFFSKIGGYGGQFGFFLPVLVRFQTDCTAL